MVRMKEINRGFWFILFVLITFYATVISKSARFWAVCSGHEQCKNGGLCLSQSCRCLYGYTGSHCEVKLQCNSFNCINNGTCELDIQANKTFCSCDHHSASGGRFKGVFCEREVPCHALGNCLNGGVCQRDTYVTGAFICKCRDGFTGPECKEETTCTQYPGACRHGGVCYSKVCSCGKNSGYTGHFCELEITPALNYSADFYWAFNRLISGFKGAAELVRTPQIGNVISLMRTGGGWVNLGKHDDRCLKNLNNCPQGISMSFWLQFIDGMYVMAITNANNTILSVQVNYYRNLLIQLKAGSKLWQIKRSCFPVGWFHLTITWNYTTMLYYENGRLLAESPPPGQVSYSSPAGSSLLSVGGLNGQGGFSTMRMSDLALWTRVLSTKEVKDMYLKKLSSPLTKRCLSVPCSSNQWCEDHDVSNSSNFTCIEPAGFYCSFDSGYFRWHNVSSNNQYWMRFSEYGSLRHDHTSNSCAGSGKFLGLVSKGVTSGSKVSSDVISQAFPQPNVPGQNVSLSMWYYMEGWTEKNLSFVLEDSTGSQTMFVKMDRQSRRWKYCKLEFSVNTTSTFQIILRGEFNGSGGIFVDDISVETFSSPVILPGKNSYTPNLHESVIMSCVVYNSFNTTWFRDKRPIKQGKDYIILHIMKANRKFVSVLKVSDVSCQAAGNYVCVSTNLYGSDQRQFTLTILDVPRPPSNVVINSTTKQITWTKVAGYECLPKPSHFVVEYKKSEAVTWRTAGYFDNRTFDLVKPSKGEKYDVRIFAKNSVGRSPSATIITFWTNIEPSEIQLFINNKAIGSQVWLDRGVKVNLRCEVKAEPMPGFKWMIPRMISNLMFYGKVRISGIKWQVALSIKSMNCRSSGTFVCLPYNAVGDQNRGSVTFGVLEPDPPKTFSVVFINITSVLISSSADMCNDVNPSAMMVRYRQQGASTWIETLYKHQAKDLVLTGQFQYETVYEFSGRLVYDGRVGVYSSLVKTRSPECRQSLGMESGAISDSQISASSQWDFFHAASQGRLHFKATGYIAGAWAAGKNDANQWLQIALSRANTRVTCVATQGRNGGNQNQWVAKYKLQHSDDEVAFQYFKEEGKTTDKVFAGNADQDTVVSHDLYPPIRARYIRFRPIAWQNHISMRVELYDCPQDLSNVTMTTHFSGQAGTTMTIYCTAVSLVASSFSWTLDHVTLQPSYRVKFDVNSTCSVLTIRMTKKTDSGNYTCKVSNSKTSLQETVSVVVTEPPRVNIRPLVRTLFEGESVTFQCDLSRGNISRLHVTWYEKAGNGQERLISNNNDSLSLTLQGNPSSSMESHVTLYRCTVRNADGVGSSPSAKLVILRTGDKAVCEREVSYGVTWSVTSAGMIDIQPCPNATGRAVRPCVKIGPGVTNWGQVDLSDCMSNEIKEIHNEILAVIEGYTVNKRLSDILEYLENVTATYSAARPGEKSSHMYEKDLTASVDALTKLIKYNAANSTRPLSNEHDISNLVKISSNLLKLSNLPAWKTALKVADDLAYQMVSALDEYGHHSTNKTSDIHIQADNIVLMAIKVSVNSSAAIKGLQMTHGQSSLDLPSTLFSQTNSSVTIVSVIFLTLGKVLTSTEALAELNTSYSNDSDWFLNSRLASITVRPRPPDVIKPPFKLALETNKVTIAGNKRLCVFLNLSRKHNKAWSTDGCRIVSSRTNSTTTTCACDHMTLFAVLMDASGDTITDARHRAALSWISIVGCIMSLIGILITLLVMFCFWKNLRSPRTVVLVNLCVAIAATDMLIVSMEIADLQNQTGCTVMAVFLHFFVLSIFCWMLSEAVQLYFSLVKVIGATANTHITLFHCLGWGLPALVVAVSLAATQGRGYADFQSCWLSTRNHVIWAFVAPALLIVSGNIVVFALVIYSMLSSHRLRKEPLARRFQRGLKASFVLLPLLGISWSFGVLTMTSDKIVFNYIFAIFNSLQGFIIFIFHCVFNKQIRDVLTERKRKKRTGFVTDAMTAHSNRKLSTTTNTTHGANSRLSSAATPLRLLNVQLLRSEISPSPYPSPTSSRKLAFEETSLASASPATPRAERDNLLQGNLGEKSSNILEATDHLKDFITTEESSNTSKPSLNMCDMDERDLTSLESSFESIDFCRDEQAPMEKQTNRKVNRR